MIHPQHWSLCSIYERLKYGRNGAMSPEDKKAYLTLPYKNAVVLDVGAYNGDSAMLFLKHGARKVIAIEPYYHHEIPNDPRIQVIPECFSLKLLDILEGKYDCIKMDIEGWEEELLQRPAHSYKPTVVEVHGQQLWKKFFDAGWQFIYKEPIQNCVALMRNFDPAKLKILQGE